MEDYKLDSDAEESARKGSTPQPRKRKYSLGPRQGSGLLRMGSHSFSRADSHGMGELNIVHALSDVQHMFATPRPHTHSKADEEDPEQAENDYIHVSFLDWKLAFMVLIALIPFGGFGLVVHFDHFSNVPVLDNVPDDDFDVVVTFFFTATCTLVGLGLESLVGLQIARSMSVTKELVVAWRFAQLLFPLLVTIAVFSKSPFGLLSLSLGLWKLGFPEVVGNMLAAVLLVDLPFVTRASHFLNSVFLFTHHLAASYVICGVISGEFELSRHIIAVVMPLIMQHWICLVKYQWLALYAMLEVLLEIWFELEVFYNNPFVPNGPRYAAYVMLVAHWGLFMGSGLKLYLNFSKASHHGSQEPGNASETVADATEAHGHDVNMSHTPRLWKRTVSKYEEKRQIMKRNSSRNLKRNPKPSKRNSMPSVPSTAENPIITTTKAQAPTRAIWAQIDGQADKADSQADSQADSPADSPADARAN